MSTKVFISWSGPRSKHVASALRDLLPEILQDLDAWMSEHDMQPEPGGVMSLRVIYPRVARETNYSHRIPQANGPLHIASHRPRYLSESNGSAITAAPPLAGYAARSRGLTRRRRTR